MLWVESVLLGHPGDGKWQQVTQALYRVVFPFFLLRTEMHVGD